MRFLPGGSDGLVIELSGLAQTLALFDRLQEADLPGLHAVIPGARTLLLKFDRFQTSAHALQQAVVAFGAIGTAARSGLQHDIPVIYDGEDLDEVMRLMGLDKPTLIARHGAAHFSVAFTGFAPGFAYLYCADPAFDLPRRTVPRVAIPAGAVALAGRFGGVYPRQSPGGWQIIGRTDVPMWDLSRPRPALFMPGDTVRFRAASPMDVTILPPAPKPPASPQSPLAFRVLRADRPALWQDGGRDGFTGQGVGQSGAMDRAAMRRANRLLGNPADDPVIEVSLGGLQLRAEAALTIALSGAPSPCNITTTGGRKITVPHDQPFALDAGDVVRLAVPRAGIYSYLALRGGYDIAPVLGSAATDTLAQLGPMPLRAGDAIHGAGRPAQAVADAALGPDLPARGSDVILDVIPGPRTDWFTATGFQTFATQSWTVSDAVDRVGMRLTGGAPIERAHLGEMVSEGTPTGAIQVPHSGYPLVFLRDHPLTGGYPVIAVIADYHLDLAAQIPPGARVRFNPIAHFAPVTTDMQEMHS